MKKIKMQKGITLVALIITIIVLLILAMVAIRAVTGDGIIRHAQRARDEYNRTSQEENGVISGYEDYINSQLGSSGGTTGENEGTSYDGMYNMPGLEGKIAPVDLFDYEPIEGTGQTAALDNSSLPQKEIKITRIKPEYCNGGGYNPETGKNDLTNTNYEIIYKGSKLPDNILVIPYQVEYEGELYKVTEINLTVLGSYVDTSGKRGQGSPGADIIVFPNIARVVDQYWANQGGSFTPMVKNVVWPKGVTVIMQSCFSSCSNLEKVILPRELIKIENNAFNHCSKLIEITYCGTKEEWNQIEKGSEWLGEDWSAAPVERIVCSDGTITL